jgi:hypothetical protein
MVDALSITWRSLRDLWDEFVFLIALNMIWVLAAFLPTLPWIFLQALDLIWVLLLTLVLLLPLPVVSAGISWVTNQITHGRSVGWGTFADGVRRYWDKGLIVALVNLVALGLIATNIQFYGGVLHGGWTNFAVSAWLVVLVYWLLAQVFWFPMLLEMENEKLFRALRFALALVIVTPGFTLTLGVLLVVVVVLSVVLTVPAVLFLAALLLLIANHATRSRLARVRRKPYKPGMDEE